MKRAAVNVWTVDIIEKSHTFAGTAEVFRTTVLLQITTTLSAFMGEFG